MSNVVINPKEIASSEYHDAVVVDEEDIEYHPLFSSEDADVILCSQDKITFRVYSLVLKLSSGWFRTLFTLPQKPTTPSASPSPQEPILVTESSEILSTILSMAYGYELPRFHDIKFIEALVHAAEKYDMPGALSIIRLALVFPSFLKDHPIQVYAIACRWGWQEEAQIASSHTIAMDLLSPTEIEKLRAVDPQDLTRLMLLHRKRRDQLKKGLDSQDMFYANIVPGRCSGCDAPNVHEKWHRMKYDWVTAVEHKPIDYTSRDLLERLELAEVLNATCLRCQKRLYNAEGTISNLRQILERLPTTVEVSDRSYCSVLQCH